MKVHGEDLNKEIEKAKQGKIKSLVDTIKDMFYNIKSTTRQNDLYDEDKEKDEEGNAFGKALQAAKKKAKKLLQLQVSIMMLRKKRTN